MLVFGSISRIFLTSATHWFSAKKGLHNSTKKRVPSRSGCLNWGQLLLAVQGEWVNACLWNPGLVERTHWLVETTIGQWNNVTLYVWGVCVCVCVCVFPVYIVIMNLFRIVFNVKHVWCISDVRMMMLDVEYKVLFDVFFDCWIWYIWLERW